MNDDITPEEFYQTCGGKWTDDLRRRFCAQLSVPGSFVNRKLAKFEKIAEDPFAIDWAYLATISMEGDGAITRGEAQVLDTTSAAEDSQFVELDDEVELPRYFSVGWFVHKYLYAWPAIFVLQYFRKRCLDSQDYSKALEFSQTLRVLASGSSFLAEEARVLGLLYWMNGNSQDARSEFELAERVARREGNRDDLIAVLTDLASFYTTAGNLERAQECYEEAHELCKGGEMRKDDEVSWISRQNSIAIFHYYRGDFQKAIEALRDAERWGLEHADSLDTEGDRIRLSGVITGNLAAMYGRLGQKEMSAKLRNESRMQLKNVLAADHPALTTEEGVATVAIRVNKRLQLVPLLAVAA